MTPSFESDLRQWVTRELEQHQDATHPRDFDWQSLNGDAGFRKYFRARLANCSLIAVYSPPESENNEAFVAIDQHLFKNGVRVPKIIAYEASRGFLLLEDLGEKLFLDYLNNDSAHGLYGLALLELLKIQQCPVDESIYPHYDAKRLRDEMELFPQWFVGELLEHSLNEDEAANINALFDSLIESALEQPQVIVHRDYHSRNLVYGNDGAPGVVDFQDAVVGPFTYDPVSLLRDCYIAWPEHDVKRWMLAYGTLAADAGVLELQDEDTLMRWFDFMGLQRHIKVLGIFARLSLRDEKHAYLKDLPLVIKYVREVAAKHVESQAFLSWFDSVLLPLAKDQDWYRDI